MTMSMTCCYEYTERHRIAFYVVGLGLALCSVGCASPYWLSGKVVRDETTSYLVDNLPRMDDPIGTVSGLKFDVKVGLWWYCVGLEGRELVCFAYPPDGHSQGRTAGGGLREDSRTYVLFIRTLMCGCLGLALMGLLVVCFYCSTCCSNGHTLGYGLLFFVAGALGFAAVFVLTFKVDVLLNIPKSSTSFGWAYPVFLTGNSLIFISSIVLCVPSSKKGSSYYETILAIDIPQHELTGQIGAFEPLPEVATLAICKTNI